MLPRSQRLQISTGVLHPTQINDLKISEVSAATARNRWTNYAIRLVFETQ